MYHNNHAMYKVILHSCGFIWKDGEIRRRIWSLRESCKAPAWLSDNESYSESICCFWEPGNLSGRVLTGETQRWKNGGTEPHLSLSSICLSIPRGFWAACYNKGDLWGVWAEEKNALWQSTDSRGRKDEFTQRRWRRIWLRAEARCGFKH